MFYSKILSQLLQYKIQLVILVTVPLDLDFVGLELIMWSWPWEKVSVLGHGFEKSSRP